MGWSGLLRAPGWLTGRFARVVVGLALAATLGACSSAPASPSPSPVPTATLLPTAGPSPTTTPTATPGATLSTAGWVEYGSARNGYAFKLPPDWTTTGATASWAFGTTPNEFVDLFWDRLQSSTTSTRLLVASQKLPAGTVAADWICRELATDPAASCPPGTFAQIPVGNSMGSIVVNHTTEFAIAVVQSGRGYLFSFAASAPTREQRQLLEALLAGVRFQPERAVD